MKSTTLRKGERTTLGRYEVCLELAGLPTSGAHRRSGAKKQPCDNRHACRASAFAYEGTNDRM